MSKVERPIIRVLEKRACYYAWASEKIAVLRIVHALHTLRVVEVKVSPPLPL
jgi:hypothetical protein